MAIDVGKSLALAAVGGMVAGLWGCSGNGKKPAGPGAEPDPTGAGTAEPAGTDDPAGSKDCCKGKNECKKKGQCRVPGKQDCAGMNECKNQGGCCPPGCNNPPTCTASEK